MTWNLLAGYAGLVSVGQQAFIGLGAYGVLWLAQHGVEPFLGLPIVVVFCAVVALPLWLLVFRLRGGYFAIATWVVAEVFTLLTIRSRPWAAAPARTCPGWTASARSSSAPTRTGRRSSSRS